MSVLPPPRGYRDDPDLAWLWGRIAEAFKLKHMFYVRCSECHEEHTIQFGMRKCQIKHLLDCCLHVITRQMTRESLDQTFREANRSTGRHPDVYVIGHGEDHARQEMERIMRSLGVEPGVPARPASGE